MGQGSGSGPIGQLNTRTVTGAAAGNLTVTGIKLGDKLVAVQPVSVAAANLVAEFKVTADNTINNTGGTSSATQTVLVIWESFQGGRFDARTPSGRSPY
jgi:hypothetical protein